MFVSGLPERSITHAVDMCTLALHLLSALYSSNVSYIQLQMGISTGTISVSLLHLRAYEPQSGVCAQSSKILLLIIIETGCLFKLKIKQMFDRKIARLYTSCCCHSDALFLS